MPMYDVSCPNGHATQVFLRAFDAPVPPCATCGEPQQRGVSAPGAFVFKGQGTYDHGWTSKRAPQ